MLQEDCKAPLAKVGEEVGLSPPTIVERIRKLENEGFIRGYHARLDARRLGLDVTAFIGVVVGHPSNVPGFEHDVTLLPEVLECHHVTGSHTLLVKVKTHNTETLERLIRCLRSIEGVERTETSVVLSTLVERSELDLAPNPVDADVDHENRAKSRAKSEPRLCP